MSDRFRRKLLVLDAKLAGDEMLVTVRASSSITEPSYGSSFGSTCKEPWLSDAPISKVIDRNI